MVIPAAIRAELEQHARAEEPNEACGLVAVRDGVAERYIAADQRRRQPVPLRARDRPGELVPRGRRLRARRLPLAHLVAAAPSRTDVENIGLWEDRPYLILSLATGELAAWRIAGGEVSPVDLQQA